MPEPALLITCEHAVNRVPDRWRALFAGQRRLLESHRGYDPGALELARHIAAAMSAPCLESQVSRLLVDHNRSPHNRALWSGISRGLPAEEKERLLNEFYRPFRDRTSRWIAGRVAAGKMVLHLSVHSFTPTLDGQVRKVDVGILYDPRRRAETLFGKSLRARLAASCPERRIRLNQPYRGRSDAHQSTYRGKYADEAYLGIELEISQAVNDDLAGRRELFDRILDSLQRTLQGGP